MSWTGRHWRHWLDRGRYPDHGWRNHLQRSALTLKGLTYAPSGALIAAATTSLPETPGGERNWDYRYTWIRDSTFMLWALHALGYEWEATDFSHFLAEVSERDDELQIMYGIQGERELAEQILEHLSGYGNARPVRIGNLAYEQRQLDVWGALVSAIHLQALSRRSLDARTWRIVKRQVEAQHDARWGRPSPRAEVRGRPVRRVTGASRGVSHT